MINCSLISLTGASSQLMLEQLSRQYVMSINPYSLDTVDDDPEAQRKILGWITVTEIMAKDFEIEFAQQRIDIIRKKIKSGISRRDLATEIKILRETISAGVEGQFLYRYSNDKKAILSRWKSDWASVLEAFPSTHKDVLSGVDLWALGHATASVFHMMRVLEHGLRALAADVGLSFETQNWQNVIDQIEAAVRSAGKNMPSGTEKSARLQFLSTAAKEFMYFKDGWRNHVSHNRADYTDEEAESVMLHVRQMMKVLSEQLSEAPPP